MKKVVFYLSLVAIMALSADGFAGSGQGGMKGMVHGGGMGMGGMTKFNVPMKDMDANSDGAIGWDEFSKRFEGTDKQVFDIIDSDRNGTLDQPEWHKFKSVHGMGMGKGMGTASGMAHKAEGSQYHDMTLPDPDKYMIHMPDIDQDGDDALTWKEFNDHFKDPDRKVYDAIDLDKDGAVTHDEWHAFKAAHGKAEHTE